MSLSHLAIEFGFFFHPLNRAVQSGDTLAEFLGFFGYSVNPAATGEALDELTDLKDAVEALSELIDRIVVAAGDPTNITEAEIAEIAAAGQSVYDAVDGIVAVVENFAAHPPGPELALELFDRLLDEYLANRLPVAREVATALDVRRTRTVLIGTPDARSIDYTEVRYYFDRLGQFLSETDQWADEVYGWGRDFDHAKAIAVIANLVESFGGRVRLQPVEKSVAVLFLTNIPHATLPVPGEQPEAITVRKAKLPVFSHTETVANGDLGATAEVGLTLLPTGDFNRPAEMGLVFAPYVEGAVTSDFDVTDKLTFSFEADAQATGGAAIAIQPSGITVKGGTAVDASFGATLNYANGDGAPIILIGNPGSTRLEAGQFIASVGGSLDGEFFVAGGVSALSAVIDFREDGLLGSIIPEPMTITAGDILIGYRPGRGVYFEGGTSLELNIPLDLDLELLRIMGLGIRLDWSDSFAVDVTIEGEVEIGPIYGYADGIGLRAKLVERKGLFGDHDLDFSFIPPTTYAVSLDFAPVEGGGLISRRGPEYRGALALKFQSIGFSAFAILNTELPGGKEGFSFAASVSAEFSVALGYGFFLTGLGGMIGINRTIDTNAMRDVLYAGNFDNLLFPADPIENAATILDEMASIFPVREGQHVFGPVARIGWGVPTLITVKLGVVIEVGREVRLLILGGLSCELPTPETAIASLKLSFFGEIDFAAGTISFDATLQSSRILTFTISGDVALRTGWALRIEHIVSFGGLHPQFPRPANLPDLRRMSIAFGTNNPRVTLSGYTAVTLNSLQFGAEAQLYAKGPDLWLIGQLAAEGWAYFNALIIFDPFAFTANLGGGISLLRNGRVVCGLGFDLTLSGPNTFVIDGKVWFTVFGQDIDFAIHHTWGGKTSLPSAEVNAVSVLRTALQQATIEPIAPPVHGIAMSFRDLADDEKAPIDPQGGAMLRQTSVPLAVTIDRVGEATVTGARRLDIRLTRAGAAVSGSTNVNADFVHGHFFKTTEAEKLRATAYDNLKAGATLTASGFDTVATKAVSASYDYEELRIPVEDDRAAGHSLGGTLVRPAVELLGRGIRAVAAEHFSETVKVAAQIRPPDRVLAGDPRFTTRTVIDEAIRTGAVLSGNGLPSDGQYGSLAEVREVLHATALSAINRTADPRNTADFPEGRGGAFLNYVATAGRMGALP